MSEFNIRSVDDAEEADAKALASITDADELEEFLRDRWSEDVLDDHVHDSKSAEASQINNDGMGEQIAYLAGGNIAGLARELAAQLYSYSSTVCVITAENIDTEDDCTTHDHEAG